MSQPIGNAFKTRIPTFSDDASIQEAFSVYHYGKDNYSESEAVPSNSIEGHFVTFNSRVGALESTVGGLSADFVLKESPIATPNIIQPEDGSSTPLSIRGKSGQTAPLQNWQDVTTTNIASVFNDGGAVFGNYVTVGNTSKSSSTALDIRIGNAAHKGITVAGVSAQTGNLQEWTSTDGSTTSVVARVNSAGKIFSNNGLTGTNTSEVVTETGTQTLTNKTITGGTVNPTTLQQGGVAAVTVSGTQTLTNKTISGGTITNATSITLTGEQTIGAFRVRNIFGSTAAPTSGDGTNGDVWIRYA
jgi:hypothetical protein